MRCNEFESLMASDPLGIERTEQKKDGTAHSTIYQMANKIISDTMTNTIRTNCIGAVTMTHETTYCFSSETRRENVIAAVRCIHSHWF